MTATTRRRIATLPRHPGLPACTTSECVARLGRDRPRLRVDSRSSVWSHSFTTAVEKAERDAILRQGVVLPETPRQRREQAALEDDLQTIPLTGKPLPVRARHSRPTAEAYLVATRGPLPYMLRLREIEQRTEAHLAALREAWYELAAAHASDPARFRSEWLERAAREHFDEVNDLIDRHNRWYPVESRLPMDPRRGDYALVNGRDYRHSPLDADWILERLPANLGETGR